VAYGEDDSYEYSVEEQQEKLYDLIGFGEPPADQYLHDLFYNYYYVNDIPINDRIDLYDRMVERLEDVYGIDFDAAWDWEEFRAWYDGAAA
jgi:hypothetical protein